MGQSRKGSGPDTSRENRVSRASGSCREIVQALVLGELSPHKSRTEAQALKEKVMKQRPATKLLDRLRVMRLSGRVATEKEAMSKKYYKTILTQHPIPANVDYLDPQEIVRVLSRSTSLGGALCLAACESASGERWCVVIDRDRKIWREIPESDWEENALESCKNLMRFLEDAIKNKKLKAYTKRYRLECANMMALQVLGYLHHVSPCFGPPYFANPRPVENQT